MSSNKLYSTRVQEVSGRTASGDDSGIFKRFGKEKITVGIIFGGRSVEHDVSLWSAQNVMMACFGAGHDVEMIYVDKDGRWSVSLDFVDLFFSTVPAELVDRITAAVKTEVIVNPGRGLLVDKEKLNIDVIFPVIHGTGGEDGVLQGCLEVASLPYVGCGVLASAIGMDKVVTKILAAQAGIPVAKYLVATSDTRPEFSVAEKELGLPMFVKPVSLGSSVGVTKVRSEEEFVIAIDKALESDKKVLIEKAIIGREIECAILEDGELRVSGVGEVATTHDFYSYEAKYLDEKGVTISLPALIPDKVEALIRQYALTLARVIGVQGLSRVDFFYSDKGETILNEINTLPGFTALSMWPMLWKQKGYTDVQIVNALLGSA